MKSPVPGLISQMKGIPTKYRYEYATVFVDHYFSYTHVTLFKNITSKDTVEAKRAFAGYMIRIGITVQ